MANTDYAFGFIPFDNVLRTGLYCVITNPTIGIYKNDIVAADIVSGAILTPFGYMAPIEDSSQADANTKLLGSVLSCFDEDMNPVNYIEAARTPGGTIAGYVMVADHPMQRFIVQANSNIGVDALGNHADVAGVAGDTGTGISKAGIGAEIVGQGNMLIIAPHLEDDATAADCRWIVQISEHYYAGSPLAGA